MALGDLMASRFSQSVSNHLDDFSIRYEDDFVDGHIRDSSDTAASTSTCAQTTSMAYLPHTIVLCERGHKAATPIGPSDCGLVSKWRPKDRSASQVHGGLLVVGYNDGSVRFFDIRIPEMLVCTTRRHRQRVVGIGFQPGLDPEKTVRTIEYMVLLSGFRA